MRLLIAEDRPPSGFRILFQAQEITRLGEEVSQTRGIGEEAAQRTLSLLSHYRAVLNRYSPDVMEVVGTEALRAAANSEEFLQRVEESLGWRIRILVPEEEAYLSLLGVRYGSPDLPAKLIVLDIGGSSTELARAAGLKIKHLVSLPVGAVNIYEDFVHADPPTTSDIDEMFSYLRDRLKPSLCPFQSWRDHLLVGTAGTITTLAAIHLGLKEYEGKLVSRVTLAQSQVRKIFDHLCQMPLLPRSQVPGLEPKRADIILSGTAVLLVTLDILGRDRIRVSDEGLREGLLLNLIGKGD